MASASCRQLPVQTPHPTRHRTVLSVPEFAEISALERDLAALCSEGMLEAFSDDEGTIRYRPVSIARAA